MKDNKKKNYMWKIHWHIFSNSQLVLPWPSKKRND